MANNKTESERMYDEIVSQLKADNVDDPNGVKATLMLSRVLIQKRFPGIDEGEAISYARGFAKGIVAGGKNKFESVTTMEFMKLADKMLDAGASYLSLNQIESMCGEINEKQ